MNACASACTPRSVWSVQYCELLRLRAILARRNARVTVSVLFVGAVAITLLTIFQALANSILSASVPHQPTAAVGTVPRCTAVEGTLKLTAAGVEPGCWTILYAPDNAATRALLAGVAAGSSLTMGVDVAPVPGAVQWPLAEDVRGKWVNASLFVSLGADATCANAACEPLTPGCMPCSLALDNRTMSLLTTDYPASVQTVVWVLGQDLEDSAFPLPLSKVLPGLNASYVISYNLSQTQYPFLQPAHAAEVKRALDEVLLGGGGAVAPELDFSLRDSPRAPPRVSGFDIFTQSGAQWTFLAPALLFFQLLTSVVVEKEEKLRVSMTVMGLSTRAYWSSWGVYTLVMATGSTAVLLISGHIAQFQFFTNAVFIAPLLLYFLTSLSYAAFALFLSSLTSAARSAQQLGYTVALISFLFIAVVGSGSGALLNLLYSTQLKPWMVLLRQALLILSPALAYTFVLYDIASLAGSTLDIRAQRIVPGPGFTLSDLTTARVNTIFNYECHLPSPLFHIGVIVFDGLLYFVAGLYLDAVLPGPQGAPSHPLFFLGYKYVTRDTGSAAVDAPRNGEDSGVIEERSATERAGRAGGPSVAVRIHGLRVVYRKGWGALFYALTGRELDTVLPQCCGYRARSRGAALGAGDVVAVKDVSLTVVRGEIVALLGHNGAGKTTTLSVITGQLPAASGSVEVAGVDVVTSGPSRGLGVCPQHDLLFPLLTAREMMRLFCGVKGVPREAWDAEIARVLASVNLADVADRLTSTFSGGMKRRLSCGLATVGSPPLVLCDEPSTGLDPLAKADLMQLLQSLKRDAGVLLTTHSMAEAADLGDRIAIMAGGRLMALGTTVELTNRYGRGYSLSLTLTDSDDRTFDAVRTRVREIAPAASLELRDGASATFTVPFAAVDAALPPLLEWADAAQAASAAGTSPEGVVKEFGVAGPTLEEAFLAVSAASHFGLAEQTLSGAVQASASDGAGDYHALPPVDNAAIAAAGGGRGVARKPRMYRALVVKNLTLLSRARGLCLCQIFTPILILGLLLVLSYLVATEVGQYNINFIPAIYLPLNIPELPSQSNARTLGGMSDVHRTLMGAAVFTTLGLPPPLSLLEAAFPADVARLRSENPLGASTSGPACYEFFLVAVQPTDGSSPEQLASVVGSFPRALLPPGSPNPPNSNASIYADATGLLSHVSASWCQVRNLSLIPVPFFDSRFDFAAASADAADGGATDRVGRALDDELLADMVLLNKVDSRKLLNDPPCWPNATDPADAAAAETASCPAYILPDGAWVVHAVNAPGGAAGHSGGGRLSATIISNTAASTSYHRPNGFSRPRPPAPSVTTLDAARLGAMDLLVRAYAGWAAAAANSTAAEQRLPWVSFAGTQVERSTTTTSDIVEILGAVLFVILLSAPLPLMVFVHVTEKELRLNEMQLSMGVRPLALQAVTFSVNVAIYAVIVGVFWTVSGGYMQLRTLSHSSPALLLLLFTGHGLALVATASLVGAFLWDREVATVMGVFLGIITPLIATSIMAGVYGKNLPWSLTSVPPPLLYAIPVLGVQFALARVLYLATYAALAFRIPLDSTAINPWNSEVGVALWSLYLSAVAYYAASVYLEAVLPRRYGVPQHPLFCCPARVRSALPAWMRAGGGTAAASAPVAALELTKPRSALSLNDAPAESGVSVGAVPFAHVARWAGAAGLSQHAATAAYALGEDEDVYGARLAMDGGLWAAAQAEHASRASGGGGGSDAATSIAERYPVLIRGLRKEFVLSSGAAGAGGGGKRTGGSRGEEASALLLAGPDEDDAGAGVGVRAGAGGSGGLVLGGDLLPRPGGAPPPHYTELEQGALLGQGVKCAVSDLTLAIPAGACFGLLGENGAGKSTSVALLQGLYPATSGAALVSGFDTATELDSVRLRLGVCPQHDVLWPSLTIAEHLLFYARVKGVPAAEEAAAVDAMLRVIGLETFAHRFASALSGGMRRRLSIGIAMMGDNSVVLLDELTTGLDPGSRRAIWRLVDAARRSHPKSLFVLISHDMAEVEALCSSGGSSCAIMTHGRVRALGGVQHLRERYGGGLVLRLAFRAERTLPAHDAAALPVGAVLAGSGDDTHAWRAAHDHVRALFPPGRGSAALDAVHGVFQTRQVLTHDTDSGLARVVEAGSALFIIAVGMRGAEVTVAQAFRTLRDGAARGGIVSWALEAQTLEAVFARVVRHYRA